ncbi:MAG: hypothetical protein UX88_C0034G0006 [Candidatus Woesebacteria bacterium GW2011_GWC2_47_16]|uniref:Peptidase C39 domain-containing protein n=5 Tax=Candidatus Woeseibacteriota TaxID=1752722 RepID=A0A0G1QU58_9BACT|nr:MAG: hypothetical protein UX03_C0012G0009 [Candidatus Woesebacteria bacterium GW2011_GWE1_45_18]KKU22426.1 MAG: hypothetical protein UX34_C0029G0017 [Candidatus Woesebacteria bacterium GW2011_GWF1_46_13]KKU48429.1 MAG: hypothetical protein UX67_C0015G0006 [Candidatus Woesebacteria bacterium GW2011_GWF2_46_8]KKU63272.1 MAG: hypothetical protein UX88_C0034G0006 [Candidatus Woesebacteria bacterium GW2011_GWC2_47_16]OGM89448.1 MAG: hypothetical protein A2597_03045 [Candidatus Woesebacteria bacte
MKEIKQKDLLGCGVACTAAVLNISYQEALSLFREGKVKVAETGFYCRDIVEALRSAGLNYEYKHIKGVQKMEMHSRGTIVFLRKSNKYPAGHFLSRSENGWMDPWLNYPHKDIQAGFRISLPEEPIYVIFPVS